MGNVTGSISVSSSASSSATSTVTPSGSVTGKFQIDAADVVKTKLNPVKYNHSLSQVARVTFTVPSPGGSYQLKIKAPTLNGSMLHKGSMAVVNYLSSLGNSTYTLTIGSSVNEGATLTGTVTTTNVDPGSGLGWQIVHTGSVSNNSHYKSISGGVVIGNDGTGTFDIEPVEDKTTNPSGQAKTFIVEITKAGTGVVATSGTITVNDTSLGPTYSLSFSPNPVNEGATVTATVTATANLPPNGTTLNWSLIASSPYSSLPTKYFSPTSGTVSINSGTGTFTISALEDRETTPGKTFQVEVRDSSGTVVVAAGTSVTVTDTSQTPGTGGSLTLASSLNNSAYVGLGDTVTGGNVYLYFFPDGTWKVRDNTGGDINGNWFTPTTPGIGAKYYINIAGTSVTTLGGGKTDNITWTQLGSVQSCGVFANAYRCVDPLTPILLDSEHNTKPAGELAVGDVIYTMHEFTKDWGYYEIAAVSRNNREKALVTFSDGSTLTASTTHKFYVGKNKWQQIFELKAGDYVASYDSGMKQIASIEPLGVGEVVSIEVNTAHTYVANKLISHNIKARDSQSFFSIYVADFTIQIADNASGTGAQQALVNLEASAGEDLR